MTFSEKTLWQNIKSGDFLPVYLVIGNESYLKQRYARLICDSAVDEGMRAFNYTELDGGDTNVDEIIESSENLPAMSEKRTVLVHDFSLDSLNDNDNEKMLSYLKDPSPDTVLVFWQDIFGFSTKTKKAKAIEAAISKHGAVCKIDKREIFELTKFVISAAKENGSSIDNDVAAYLIENSGDDMNMLQNEMLKLSLYAGNKIEKHHIDEIASKTVEATAFKMTDAVSRHDNDTALMYLDALFEQKTDPSMICGAVISTYVDMYRAKVSAEYSDRTLLKQAFKTQYKSDFRIRKAENGAAKYSKTQLRSCLELLSKADSNLKGAATDKKLIFQKLITELQRV